MTQESLVRDMERSWQDAHAQAEELKDPFRALELLRTMYHSFRESERKLADEVLQKWALSEREVKRFDAMVLIDEFRITAALPALEQLIDRLELSDGPGVPFERDLAQRIVRNLSSSAGQPGVPPPA